MRFKFRKHPLQEIQRFRLEEGDVLVVKTAERLSASHAEQIREAFAEKFDGTTILVVPPNISFAVIKPWQVPREAAT